MYRSPTSSTRRCVGQVMRFLVPYMIDETKSESSHWIFLMVCRSFVLLTTYLDPIGYLRPYFVDVCSSVREKLDHLMTPSSIDV